MERLGPRARRRSATRTRRRTSKFLKYASPATVPVFGAACIALGAAAGTGAELGGIDATTRGGLVRLRSRSRSSATCTLPSVRPARNRRRRRARTLHRRRGNGSYAIPRAARLQPLKALEAGTIGLAAIADAPRVAIARPHPALRFCRSRAITAGHRRAPRPSRRARPCRQRRRPADDQLSDLPRAGRIDDGKEVERETAARFSSSRARLFRSAASLGRSSAKPRTSARAPTPGRRCLRRRRHRRACRPRGPPSRRDPRRAVVRLDARRGERGSPARPRPSPSPSSSSSGQSSPRRHAGRGRGARRCRSAARLLDGAGGAPRIGRASDHERDR